MNRLSLTSYTQLDKPSQLCQLNNKIIAYKKVLSDQTIDQAAKKCFAVIYANNTSLDPIYWMEDIIQIKIEPSVLEKHDYTFRCDLHMNICTSKGLKQIYIRKLSVEELKEIHENSYFSTPFEAPYPPHKRRTMVLFRRMYDSAVEHSVTTSQQDKVSELYYTCIPRS